MNGECRPTTRRAFLGASIALIGGFPQPRGLAGRTATSTTPRVDLHAHLDNSTIERVAELGRASGVRLGIVEHAGTKENNYPVVLSDDRELTAYLDMLQGHGVFKGVQAEWIDWHTVFSPGVLTKLDYVLTDTMTFPDPEGRRVKLWEPEAAELVDMTNPDKFMDRYVDWHLEVMSSSPIDILGNASWLPVALAVNYETLWTEDRIGKVVDAANERGIAIEISASYRIPSERFLRIARDAGTRFSFGSNGRYPNMGKIDHSLKMAEALDLNASRIFVPDGQGSGAVKRWFR